MPIHEFRELHNESGMSWFPKVLQLRETTDTLPQLISGHIQLQLPTGSVPVPLTDLFLGLKDDLVHEIVNCAVEAYEEAELPVYEVLSTQISSSCDSA
jgi:hypothetical protein